MLLSVVLVVFDAARRPAQLHLWVDGATVCGAQIVEPSFFEAPESACVDIGCARCFDRR
jgi:hypothetical protein